MDLKVLADNGVVGICVILTAHLLVKVGEFLWRFKEKKDSLSESAVKDLTKAVDALTLRLSAIEPVLSELPKIKKDLRRFYAAVKALSGEKWPDIRKEILEDDLTV